MNRFYLDVKTGPYSIEKKKRLRYCFSVNLSTILWRKVRSPEPQRRVQLVVGANGYDFTHEIQFNSTVGKL